ncbi:MAG: DNA-3-methyladenine glycosylase [Candidatus Binatus sp.]|jgi:DNA-3-methyladenine glycosylase II|uniref:DNA-3-methyladenine glycosylase family protein n=1 Tax=Candidatus Binatus sp. TaxID=2811406 RepID=UPI003CB7FF50
MPTDKVPYARKARTHLSKADPVLARIIAEVGALGIQPRRERFQALVRNIIFQQLAGAAANAIYGRFVGLFPGVEFPSPEQVLAKTDAQLRSVGLSEKKVLYIKDLAAHVRDGKLNFHRFHRMTDEEIVAHLTQVKGIGKWTAEIFLMFNLGRPDVMPADDLGVQNAVQRHYRMRQRPNRKRLLKHAERWRPYRTAAAWYLWRSLDIVLPDAGAKPTAKAVAKRKQR